MPISSSRLSSRAPLGRIRPWYFLATDGHVTRAFGVTTAPSALCFWQVDPEGISLWCDLGNGGRAVQLGPHELTIAQVVTRTYSDRSPFQPAQDFCRLMCDKPRLPKMPIYSGNNWYYAYGHSSASDIRQDSELMASVSESLTKLPVMVIDDGWQPNPTAGPWRTGNSKFPDMSRLASDMRKIGVKPALWTRPLFTKDKIRNSALLRPNTLDPTDAEAAALIEEDLRTVGHLSAGLFEARRTGDDTSGRDWNRTIKMDVKAFETRQSNTASGGADRLVYQQSAEALVRAR